jgi:hypothetical protein
METYKLSDFGLIKHCLKRKLGLVDPIHKDKLIKILNQRTTIYDLETIEFIIMCFYSDVHGSNSPLGIYYSRFNKNKYEKLNSNLIAKKSGINNIEKDVKKVLLNLHKNITQHSVFISKLNDISEMYNVPIEEVNKIASDLENKWLV